MLNTAAAERALKRIGREIMRLIETDPAHVDRIRALLPPSLAQAAPDPVVDEVSESPVVEPESAPAPVDPAEAPATPTPSSQPAKTAKKTRTAKATSAAPAETETTS